MTQEEYNQIYCVNGMAYNMRDEFISEETTNLHHEYLMACKTRIQWKIKHYGDAYQTSKDNDLKKALQLIRLQI